METKLYVGNLSYKTTEQDLRTMFNEVGSVMFVEVIKDRQTGDPKGFAFVTMNSQEEADKAISTFNGKIVDERPLRVNIAKPREDQQIREVQPAQAVLIPETGRISNEAAGYRPTQQEIGRTNNEQPGPSTVEPETGVVSNEAPGVRDTEQEIGSVNND
jgi:RNA recognition motif-containing protein